MAGYQNENSNPSAESAGELTTSTGVETNATPGYTMEALQRRLKREITARKEAERLIEDKSRELWVANRDLKVAVEKAEEASRAKSSFLANMSHEIRTPMNGVLGMAEHLWETSLSSDQAEMVRFLTDSATSLLSILDDVLDLSKMGAGQFKITKSPFDLRRIVSDVVGLFRPRAAEKDVTLLSEVDPTVPAGLKGDANRLRQVLSNLVGNAVKFTSDGSIVVRVIQDADAETTVIEVQDDGIGIPADRQKDIFQSFTQASGTIASEYGGTGLGLAISSRLVELMGGSIEVESEDGKGSTFRCRIPMPAAEVSTQSAHRTVVITRFDGSRVLLAEDNAINRAVATRSLARLGCEVSIAEDGEQAVDALQRERFDLVLMDCQMPVLSGYEATLKIRKGDGILDPNVPVIALTANSMEDDRQRCLEHGMDDYLAKPFSFANFAEVLSRFLKKRD
ncbi:MAG: ATP-binding protein [Planctomycetota bacterium]